MIIEIIAHMCGNGGASSGRQAFNNGYAINLVSYTIHKMINEFNLQYCVTILGSPMFRKYFNLVNICDCN